MPPAFSAVEEDSILPLILESRVYLRLHVEDLRDVVLALPAAARQATG